MKYSNGLSSIAVLVAALTISTAFVSPAYCQNNQFTGATSNDWDDATNWTLGTLPDNTQDVLTEVGSAFGGALSAEVNISSTLTIDTIWEFRVARGDGSVGVVNHSAGTLNTSGWSFVGVDAAGAVADGTYNLSGDAVLTGGDTWFLGLGGGTGSNRGHMSFADNSSATFGAFVVGANDGNEGTVIQSGGSVQYNSWMTIGESSGATGMYDISGGSLTQNADFLTIGQQDGGNGTLCVSGSATVSLNASGIILGRLPGGSGRLESVGSAASINTTDLLVGINDGFGGDPPFKLGDPTGNGTLSFIADSTGITPVIASGNVYLNDGTVMGAADLELDLSELGTGPPSDLLLVEVGGTLTGTFSGLAEGADVGFGRTITYEFGDGNDIGLLAAGGKCDFALGDVNQDGIVSLLDVNPFVELLTTGGFLCEADINLDGAVTLLDVDPFVVLLTGG